MHLDAAELLRVYRSIMASELDEEVCWWYSGTTHVRIPGRPDIPVIRSHAIMSYRTQTISATECRIHWREVGCFADVSTGEASDTWVNPLTAAQVPAPRSFREGPGMYTVRAQGAKLLLEMQQPHAVIEGGDVEITVTGDCVCQIQRERKRRGFPLPDGTMPPAAAGFEARTELTYFTTLREIADSPGKLVRARGVYSFELSGTPPWMGFAADSGGRTVITGTITKARPAEVVHPWAARRLNELFP
jgi:hypothetical protein